jgi:hypothetical protein
MPNKLIFKMKYYIQLSLVIVLLSQCRYKDNDRISLRSVKTRLEKTWVLKEGIRDGRDLTTFFLNEELSFAYVSNSKVSIKTSGFYNIYYAFNFKNHKTTIYAGPYELKITKLTNKELWMEGNGIIGILSAGYNDIIKVKYHAK